MTDKQMYKELEKFANDHPLSRDIKVTISPHNTSFVAVGDGGANYDDVVFLSQILAGAKSYLFWKRRLKGGKK
jgi:hypothetical protein